jgi:hypothetical protein
MFSMEESPDYIDDSEPAEPEEPTEGFTNSKSDESRKSVMWKQASETSPLSKDDSEDFDDNIPEHNGDNEPTEA